MNLTFYERAEGLIRVLRNLIIVGKVVNLLLTFLFLYDFFHVLFIVILAADKVMVGVTSFANRRSFLIIFLFLLTLGEKCPYSELFWSAFSHIRTEYGPE